jgi:hypothetical protein
MICFAALFAVSASGNEIDRLLEEYGKIERVSCRVRRIVEGKAGTYRFLSRVYYSHDDRLNVENLSPVKRRIVCNGTIFFSYAEGDPKGFSTPVVDLSEEMLVSLRKVPGSAMDHFLRLKGVKQKALPGDEEFPRRFGYQAKSMYVVLGLDADGRPAGVDMYVTSEMKQKHATYRYSKFTEVVDGVFIPFEHAGTLFLHGEEQTHETTRLDAYEANGSIAEALFKPGNFFDKKVEFVDSFKKIYQ